MVCRGCIRYGHGIFCYNHQTGYIFGILCVQLHLESQGKRCILCPIVCGIWLCASFYPPWFCYYTFRKSRCDITSFSSSIIRSRNASNTSSSILNGGQCRIYGIYFPSGHVHRLFLSVASARILRTLIARIGNLCPSTRPWWVCRWSVVFARDRAYNMVYLQK